MTGPLKILRVHNHYLNRGGEDVAFEAETELLTQGGHQVQVIEDSNKRLLNGSSLRAATETIWSKGSYRMVATAMDRMKPDVVHFHNTFLALSPSVYWAAASRGAAVVKTLHNYRLLCPGGTLLRDGLVCENCIGKSWAYSAVRHGCFQGSKSKSLVVSAMLRGHQSLGTWRRAVDAFICLSDFAKGVFVRGGWPEEKLKVLPNVVPDFPRMARKGRNFPLYVGRLSAEKGIPFLLEAWPGPGAPPLVVVGSGPMERAIMEARQQGRLAHVDLKGEVSPTIVRELMSEASFLVVPSHSYEHPLVIMEAFAAGLPVLAARMGAVAGMIQHGINGFLYDPHDIENFRASAVKLAQDEALVESLGRGARQTYEDHHRPAQHLKDLETIYRHAMKVAHGKKVMA